MTTDKDNSFPLEWLRHTSPYINTHRRKTFVVWLSDELLGSPSLKNIVYDLTLLSHLGVRLVLVHGMRKQIDETLQASGIEAQFACPVETNDTSHLMRITTKLADMVPSFKPVTSENASPSSLSELSTVLQRITF